MSNRATDDQISSESGVDEDQVSLTESQKGDGHNAREFFVSRPIYDNANFFSHYRHEPNRDRTLKEKFRSFLPEITSRKALNSSLSIIPLLSWLPKYKIRKSLPSDIAAGLTVGVMNIPQGLAYALLASLPPIVGLYTSFIPVLVYFALGTSRHLAVGTFAIISTMVGEVCENQLSNSNLNATSSSQGYPWSPKEEQKLQIAVSLTLLVGVIQAAMGLVHLGFVTVYLSRPLVSGFTTGAAFIVFTSQVKHFFGMTVPRYSDPLALPKTYIHIFKNISETNVAALLTGLICVLILVAIDYLNRRYQLRLPCPIPSQLIVIIIGAAVSHLAKLNSKFDVLVIGEIPKGLPNFAVPDHRKFGDLIVNAFLISIVAATTNLSLVKLFAQKNEYQTDSNQELLAYGTVNIISSFFSCFVSSGSLSRSVVQESFGKTQIASLVSSLVILLVLIFIAPLFEPLPKAVLAAIVVVSLRRLFMQFQHLKAIGKISQVDAFIWLISCFAVVLLGIVLGLILGFGVTLLSIIYRSSRAKVKTLGHVGETELYKDRTMCLSANSVDGILILQFQGPLIFVNAEDLLESVLDMIRDKWPDKVNFGEGIARTTVDTEPEILSNYLVEAVVVDGDKQVNVTMVRTVNPMFSVNSGLHDVAEKVPGEGSELRDVSECSLSPDPLPWTVPLETDLRSVVLDLLPVTIIDYVGIKCLRQMIEKSKEMEVNLYVAGCSYYLLRHIARDEFLRQYLEKKSFITVHDAVLYCRRKNETRLAVIKKDEPTTSDSSEQEAP